LANHNILTGQINGPTQLGDIRNFSWIMPGMLARGEQPPLDRANFMALRDSGVQTVISLRAHEARKREVAGRIYPPYRVRDERVFCSDHGLVFRHIPLEDFAVPSPRRLIQALELINLEVAANRSVYIHCLAGVGRTGLVVGAWQLASGWMGSKVAATFFSCCEDLCRRRELPLHSFATFLTAIGAPQQWWALQVVARISGASLSFACAPISPFPVPCASEWESECLRLLRSLRCGTENASPDGEPR
jgi:hypothetical protein